MNKKHFSLFIPLMVLMMIGLLSGNAYSIGGHFENLQSGIGGTIYDCNKCHDFNGLYGGGDPYGTPTAPPAPSPGTNLRWLKSTFEFCSTSTNIACDVDEDCPEGETCGITSGVNFRYFTGTDDSFANTDTPDGPCQVCHTASTTVYWRKDGTGTDHYPGENCTSCHPHFTEDYVNYFQPTFVGGQSHFTHLTDPKGPMFGIDGCTNCHSTYDFHFFADDKPLVPEVGYPEGTAVCNPCHSNDGDYHGVDDSVIGAKPNWESAIYEPAVAPAEWPSRLKAGKEDWCAGCHDSGTSVIYGVSAPNVMGDDTLYGYNVNGHGVQGATCSGPTGCHATTSDDTTANHTDGDPRTYNDTLDNYQKGYRLSVGMAIPRYGQVGPSAFALCWECHDFAKVFYSESFFRNDNTDTNLHEEHLDASFRATYAWDSDWSGGFCDGVPDHYGEGCDSAISCTACHNVHGSPCLDGSKPISNIIACYDPLKTPMIRHGDLISTPGTQDKVPALQFNWYMGDLSGPTTPTTDFDASRWGELRCSNSDVSYNKVCWGCHSSSTEVTYYRGPCGVKKVTVNSVSTTDTANNPKTDFYPGDWIRYHVNFSVSGTSPTYWLTEHGLAQKTTGTGPKHEWWYSNYLNTCNTYEWTIDKHIPSSIVPPPGGIDAAVTITMELRDIPGGTLLYSATGGQLFYIVPLP